MICRNISIIYMVAGLSSRFGGKIKQFAEVGKNGETFIECSLNQSLKAGFNKIIFVVGNLTEKPFREKFGDSYKGIPVYYAIQDYDISSRDKPWGTVDALCSAKNLIDSPFVVCTGDDLYGENSFQSLFDHLKLSSDCATVGYKLKDTLPAKGEVTRAIFEISGQEVKRISNTFQVSKEDMKGKDDEQSCMTIFGLHPSTLEYLEKSLEDFKYNSKNSRTAEFLLHLALSNLIEEEKIKMKIYFSKDPWMGITNPEDEILVRDFIRYRKI